MAAHRTSTPKLHRVAFGVIPVRGKPLARHDATHGLEAPRYESDAVADVRAIVKATQFAAATLGAIESEAIFNAGEHVPARIMMAAHNREANDAVKADGLKGKLHTVRVEIATFEIKLHRLNPKSKEFAVMSWLIENRKEHAMKLTRKIAWLHDTERIDRWATHHLERNRAAAEARKDGVYAALRQEWQEAAAEAKAKVERPSREAKILRGAEIEARTAANREKRKLRRWGRIGILIGSALKGEIAADAGPTAGFADELSTLVVEKLVTALTRRSISMA